MCGPQVGLEPTTLRLTALEAAFERSVIDIVVHAFEIR
jgi:hypothetical protein